MAKIKALVVNTPNIINNIALNILWPCDKHVTARRQIRKQIMILTDKDEEIAAKAQTTPEIFPANPEEIKQVDGSEDQIASLNKSFESNTKEIVKRPIHDALMSVVDSNKALREDVSIIIQWIAKNDPSFTFTAKSKSKTPKIKTKTEVKKVTHYGHYALDGCKIPCGINGDTNMSQATKNINKLIKGNFRYTTDEQIEAHKQEHATWVEIPRPIKSTTK